MRVDQCTGFLLTRQSFDRRNPDGIESEFWVTTPDGPYRLMDRRAQAIFYFPVDLKDRALQLFQQYHLHGRLRPVPLQTFDREPVYQCAFASLVEARQAHSILQMHKVPVYEADLRVAEQLLMSGQITAGVSFSGPVQQRDGYREVMLESWSAAEVQPVFRILSLDVECAADGHLYSVAGIYREPGQPERQLAICIRESPAITDPSIREDVPVVDLPSAVEITWVSDEKTLLQELGGWFVRLDPDVVIGWNVINFDFKLLIERAGLRRVPLRWGRGNRQIRWRATAADEQNGILSMAGRMVIDGIDALKSATFRLDRYNLEFVAQYFLGTGKAIDHPDDRLAEITRLFLHDKPALIHYNVQDCRLVLQIFDHCHLLPFLALRSQLTGLELSRYGGSVAAFSHLYIPRLHQAGFVAPNMPVGAVATSPGGYVMNSRPGFYHNVLVLDFKSLYPSIIRTFHIDPLALIHGVQEDDAIPGFVGGKFSRTRFILPALIDHLWQAREQAKQEQDAPRSQAIKILMNAFYGVLGSTGCRFFDPRLASSITMRGHWIMQRTRSYIEQQGYTVIYGDTDSTFVWIEQPVTHESAEQIGRTLVAGINAWWQQILLDEFAIPSHLEIQFERHFHRFLMPTLRGAAEGSKKRYAGVCMVNGQEQMIFKGLETVRSDWTPLAKQFQQTLYQLIFQEQDPSPFIHDFIEQTRTGQLDELLVYRKRIRRELVNYDKVSPPHVRAARMANEQRRKEGRPPVIVRKGWIEYVMTVQGPEPVDYQQHPLDYQHYIEKQLKPVAEAILPYVHLTFAQFDDQQLSLF